MGVYWTYICFCPSLEIGLQKKKQTKIKLILDSKLDNQKNCENVKKPNNIFGAEIQCLLSISERIHGGEFFFQVEYISWNFNRK